MNDTISDIVKKQANSFEVEIIEDRRRIHEFAEIGFELPRTTEYVMSCLDKLGIEVHTCGKAGVVAAIGKDDGQTVLLRADMDALPIKEQSELPFAAKNGNMHACGHDMHTAMLLGAARILSSITDKISGRIVFAFQPAEETLQGARDMIEHGLIEEHKPDMALMLHTLVGMPMATGTVIVSSGGVSAPSADFFRITVNGKSSHGSTPHLGINAITVASHIISIIESISVREFPVSDDVVLSIGSVHAGTAPNVIADLAVIEGTLRTYDENVREQIKARLARIVSGISDIYFATAEIEFTGGCPTLVNDEKISSLALNTVTELYGKEFVCSSSELGGRGGGSEDFAYISQEVPSVMLALVAGSNADGYTCPSHNSQVVYDEKALKIGAVIYAYCALKYLREQDR